MLLIQTLSIAHLHHVAENKASLQCPPDSPKNGYSKKLYFFYIFGLFLPNTFDLYLKNLCEATYMENNFFFSLEVIGCFFFSSVVNLWIISGPDVLENVFENVLKNPRRPMSGSVLKGEVL
jgi:hypothetical protein